jgi:predicted PurR-regulated permease PerM
MSRASVSIAVPLWVLAIIGTALFLRYSQSLLVPIALACLIAYALYPVVLWLERMKIPRALGAALVVLALAALAGFTAWSLRDDFASAVSRLPAQIRELRHQLESAGQSGTLDGLRKALAEMRKAADSAQLMGGASAGGDQASSAPGASTQTPSALQQYLWQGPANIVALAGHVTVITFLVYFLMVGARAWRQRLIALSGDLLSSRRTGTEVLDDVTAQIQRFLIVRVITGVVVGVATWAALLAFGAPAPAFWGLAAGVLNSVPYFGPVIVSVGLGLVGLFSGGITMSLKLAGVALAITSLEGWVLSPPLMGRAAHMNTLAVFIALLFWSWAWGVWGTLLAVPIMMVCKAVCDHVERLQPISRLLGSDRL